MLVLHQGSLRWECVQACVGIAVVLLLERMDVHYIVDYGAIERIIA
jgi:hypothetical protein